MLEDFTTISSRLSESDSSKTTNRSNAFPVAKSEKNIFSRRFLDKNTQIGKIKDSIIYITRKTVLQNKPAFAHSCILITSGIKTWRESVKKGYWINGTTDSMGQSELDQLGLITKGKDVENSTEYNTQTVIAFDIKAFALYVRSKGFELEATTNFITNNAGNILWFSKYNGNYTWKKKY